jgi:hypothetical protein
MAGMLNKHHAISSSKRRKDAFCVRFDNSLPPLQLNAADAFRTNPTKRIALRLKALLNPACRRVVRLDYFVCYDGPWRRERPTWSCRQHTHIVPLDI